MTSSRYTRQVRLAGFGPAAQQALTDARVVVIGAGGLGAPVLTYLAAAGVGRIDIVDPDVVELTNLHRQFLHAEDTVGHRKVDSAAQRLRGLNSEIAITTHPVLLTAANAEAILAGADAVVDGSDNFATRYLVNDACEILGIPLVWGTILGFDGQLAVFDARTGATLRDLYPDVPAPGSVPDCATAGVIGALCGSIGSAMAMETIKVLTGIGTPLRNAVSIHSSLEGTWETVPVARNPQRPAVTNLDDHLGEASPADDPTSVPAPSTTITWDAVGENDVLIDIRDDAEVAPGMVAGARHVPMAVLLTDPEVLRGPEALTGEGRLALYCRSGIRSAKAVTALRERGIDAVSVSGGYMEYLSRVG